MKITILSSLIGLTFSTLHASPGMWAGGTVPNSMTNAHNGFDSLVTPQGRQLVVHTLSNTKLMLSERVSPISSWTSEEIFDAQLFSIRDVEFLSDENGGLHVAFITRGNILGVSTAIRYGYRAPGGDWTFTILGEADPSDSSNEGYELSLDLQTNGLAAIAYTGDNGTLRYIARTEDAFGAWFDTVIDDSPDSGLFPSLKHRTSFTETTFISHYDQANEQLLFSKLARPFGAPKFSWSTSVVDNLDNPGRYSSLCFTGSGEIAIAYNTSFLGRELRFAVRDGAVWNREVVDAPIDGEQVGMHCHLSMDALGQPQITYTTGRFFLGALIETNIEEIRHARALPDGSWGIETAVRFEDEENAFRLALTTDLAGTPHAIYFHGDRDLSNKLHYTRPFGSAWVAEDLAGDLPEGSLIRGASLDFAPDGTRVINVPITANTADSPDPVHQLYLLTEKDDQSHAGWYFQGGQINSTRTLIHENNRNLILTRSSDRIHHRERRLGAGVGDVIDSQYISHTDGLDYDLAIDSGGNLHLVMEADNTIAYYRAPSPGAGEELAWERQAEDVDFGEGQSPAIAFGPDGEILIAYLGPDGLHPNPAPGQSMIKTAYLPEGVDEWQTNTIEAGSRLGRSLDLVFNLNRFDFIACEISEDGYSSNLIIGNPLTGERDFVPAVAGQVSKIVAIQKSGAVHVTWRAEHQHINSSNDRFIGDRYLGYLHYQARLSFGERELEHRTFPTVALPLPADIDRYNRTFDNLDIAIDPKGFPVIVTNTAPDIGVPEAPGSLLLIRPADSLDLDQDGMSLLYESAFGTDPTIFDPIAGGRNTVYHNDGFFQFSTFFQHRSDLTPIIGSGPNLNPNRCYLGAFELGIQSSEESPNDFRHTFMNDDLIVVGDVPGRPGFRETGFARVLQPAYTEENPKVFFRHTVRRVLPKTL